MPPSHRDEPIVINLTGERAERLAERLDERLLAPRPSAAAERLWSALASRGGGGTRAAHDGEPTQGRLTIVAGRAPRR